MRSVLSLLLTAATVTAFALDAPLTYVPHHTISTSPKIATIKVADFDMLAPGARPAPLSLDLGTSQGAGIVANADDPSVPISVHGRTARYNPRWNGCGFYADQAYTANGSKKDLYVLVEYLDDGTSGLSLQLGSMSAQPDRPGGYTNTTGPLFQHSGQWKTHQFHVTDAKWDRRSSQRAANPASDFWFTFSTQTAESAPQSGMSSAQPSLQPPAGNYKLPRLIGSLPFYAQVHLGDKPLLVAIDRTTSEATFYNRVWFDANGNGDLTDDPTIVLPETPATPGSLSATFPVDATIQVGERALPYRFLLEIYCSGAVTITTRPDGTQQIVQTNNLNENNFAQLLRCYISPDNHYAATINLGGVDYRIALGDGNCNGRFGDQVQLPPPTSDPGYLSGDYVRITTSTLSTPIDGLLGDQLVLGNKLYDIKVDDNRSVLSVSPATGQQSTVKLAGKADALQLYSTDRKRFVVAATPGAEIPLAEGTYALYSYSTERPDPSGDIWELEARAGTQPPIATAAQAAARETSASNLLTFGEPYVPRVTVPDSAILSVRKAAQGASQKSGPTSAMAAVFGVRSQPKPPEIKIPVPLQFELKGAGGEAVTGITHKTGDKTTIRRSAKNSTRPAEPQYKIAREDGELVASGQFEYG